MDITIIQDMEERLRLAMLSSDVAILDTLIGDDLIFTIHTGQIVNKETDLEGHRSGALALTMLEPSEQQVRCYNGFAVVSVRMDITGSFSGIDFSGPYRYTRVWEKREDTWLIVAAHVSQILLF